MTPSFGRSAHSLVICSTCARYVLLAEPTVSPSFELQAVGRVDRLGQTQETRVICYATMDTMDENILKLSGECK